MNNWHIVKTRMNHPTPAELHLPAARKIRSRLRIRHLELLLALDELRSLHKASAQLNMTQPAASKLLREIEDMFGVPLFDRSHRGITPTIFGTALFRKASLVLAELDGARDELDSLMSGASARIRVGVLQVVLPVLVPQTLARLRSEHPGITVMLQEGANDVLLTALSRGELDCVVGRLMPNSASTTFTREVLYDEPVCVVARIGHPLAGSTRVTPAALARQEWILPPSDAPLRQSIERYFLAEGVSPPTAMIESVSLLLNDVLLRGTDMVAAMPYAVARHYAQLNALTILRFQPDWILPLVGVVTRTDVLASPGLESFLAALRSVVKATPGKAAKS